MPVNSAMSANTAMPVSIAMPSNSAMPENTAIPMFQTVITQKCMYRNRAESELLCVT